MNNAVTYTPTDKNQRTELRRVDKKSLVQIKRTFDKIIK